jgi:NADH-quinone oxidoreductase subunit E
MIMDSNAEPTDKVRRDLKVKIAASEHPRELVVDVLFALQSHTGWLSDAAVAEAADMLSMTPLEVEELATFYTFLYRERVGKYVIHICDSLICHMNGGENLKEHLCERLGVELGGTSTDGLFTLLPVCCIGYCDLSPAMLVNRKVYGPLNRERIDEIIDLLRAEAADWNGGRP